MKKVLLPMGIALSLLTITIAVKAQQPAKNKTQPVTGSNNSKSTGVAKVNTVTATPVSPKKTTTPAVSNTLKRDKENSFSIGANLEPGLPVSDLSKVSSFVLGVNAMAKYSLSEKLAVRASIGYMTYFAKTQKIIEDNSNGNVQVISIKPNAVHAVPLQAGLSYLVTDHIFIIGSAGTSFLSDGGGTAFIYSPGIGYQANRFEAIAKYERLSKTGTISFIGLQLGYFFKEL
jgi:hypothetical protein